MKKALKVFFIVGIVAILCLLVNIPFSFAQEDVQYIYLDLNAGKITINGSTYTGYIFETVEGQTSTKTVSGTHLATNKYYIYQSNNSNKSTTGNVDGTFILPEYERVEFNSQSWGEYITNNTVVYDVINNWNTAAAAKNRTATANWIQLSGAVNVDLTIDNLWSSYQVNKNSGSAGGISSVTTNAEVSVYFIGDNRFGNIHHTASESSKSKLVFSGTGTITVANMSNQKGYNHYNSIIGSSDGSNNSNGLVFNSGTVYAGATPEDNCSAIGGGGNGLGGVTINGGTITAVASSSGAAIGGGIGESSMGGDANISINGGTIYAYNFGYASTMSGVKRFIPAVAIGGGSSCLSTGNSSTIINITGGKIFAQCLAGSAIGGGSSSTKNGGSATINIDGSDTYIEAVSLENATYSLPAGSGIGGGTGGTGGNGGSVTLNIKNGTILTQDIGGGRTNNSNGTIGSAKIDITGGVVQGRFIMDSTNLSSGATCYFKMSGGLIDNEEFSVLNENGMAVHIVGGTSTGEAVAQLSGGTIKNCDANLGGAIYIADGGSFAMSGGNIESSSALMGGAVYLDGGSFTMSNGNIKSCVANDQTSGFGGAVYMSSGTFSMSGGNIIDCSSAVKGGAVYMTSGTFEMSDGILDNCDTQISGGAVYLLDGSFTLVDGQIKNSNVNQTGGAVYQASGTFTVKGGSISLCEAIQNGGAVFLESGIFKMENGLLENCESTLNGGAVYMTSGTFEMLGGNISNCSASKSGGAVYLVNGEFLMGGGTLEDCLAVDSGGAIYINDGFFVMSEGIINKCSATKGNNAYGGAVYLNSGEVSMTAGRIAECSSTLGGGAVYVSGGNFELSGSGLIENCSSVNGGGVYVNNGDIIISSEGTVKGCKATNGGGMAVFSGNVTIDGGHLINNQVTISGGGIYASSDTMNLLISVLSGTINGNTTLGNGGAIGVEVGDGFAAHVVIGKEICGGDNENHSHPIIKDNTATDNGGGIYLKGKDVTLDIYCGSLHQNIAINNAGSADLDQTGGNVTIFGGEIGENVSISGGSFSNKSSEELSQITIIFNSNFEPEQTSSVNISEGMKISLPSNLFNRQDYLLVGWSLVENPTEEQIIPLNTSYVVPHEPSLINMYAIWKYRGSGVVLTPAISSGKHYESVSGQTTTIVACDSELSAEFAVEGMIPKTYTNRTLIFNNELSVGTTILMIDYSDVSSIQYYYYKVLTSGIKNITLVSFIKNGSNVNYFESQLDYKVDEKFIFIIDFDNNTPSGANEFKLYRYATNIDEAPIIQNVAYVLTESREFSLTINKDIVKLGENISVSYQPKNPIGEDVSYDSRSMALVISAKEGGSIPNDAELTYGSTKIKLNSNGQFIIPFGMAKQQNQLEFMIESLLLARNEDSVEVEISLWVSLTSDGSNPLAGEKVYSDYVEINSIELPSFKIESLENRVFTKSQLKNQITLNYSASNLAGCTVSIHIERKVSGVYVKQTEVLESVDNISNNVGGVFDISNQTDGVLKLKFREQSLLGTYRVVVNIEAENGEMLTEIYNFAILN